jgi:hypothetical protein
MTTGGQSVVVDTLAPPRAIRSFDAAELARGQKWPGSDKQRVRPVTPSNVMNMTCSKLETEAPMGHEAHPRRQMRQRS